MDYITIKRASFESISGPVNLPYGTNVCCEEGLLSIEGAPICGDRSQNAYDFFSRNDDGNGLERGKLVQAIRKMLESTDKEHQVRWDKVWGDSVCQKYNRKEHADFWLWSYEFYNADIYDLRYIAKLIGVKGDA